MKLSVAWCFIIISLSSWGFQAFQWRGYDCPAYEWKCGNICLPGQFTPQPICQYGNATFSTDSSLQCCVQPDDSCVKVSGSWPTLVNCQNGTVLDKSETCHGSCYNDNSPYLTFFLSGRTHYKCPDTERCIAVDQLCRGVDWCNSGSADMCDEGLDESGFCDREHPPKPHVNVLQTELVDGNNYCNITENHRKVQNSDEYDNIDRSDENNVVTLRRNNSIINVSRLEFCEDKIITLEEHNKAVNISKGIVCKNSCLKTTNWCWQRDSCIQNDTEFFADDIELCRNSNFWKNVSCTQYDFAWTGDDELVQYIHFGLRCNGSVQMCIYPWYVQLVEPDLDPYWRRTQCYDKSDQVFEMKTCPNIHH